MSRGRLIKRVTAFNAQAATGVSPAILSADYSELSFSVIGDNTADMTVKIIGAKSEDSGVSNEPDFSVADGLGNSYSNIQVLETNDSDAFDGVTGLTIAADGTRAFTANVDDFDWIGFEVDAYTSGDITVHCSFYSNQ